MSSDGTAFKSQEVMTTFFCRNILIYRFLRPLKTLTTVTFNYILIGILRLFFEVNILYSILWIPLIMFLYNSHSFVKLNKSEEIEIIRLLNTQPIFTNKSLTKVCSASIDIPDAVICFIISSSIQLFQKIRIIKKHPLKYKDKSMWILCTLKGYFGVITICIYCQGVATTMDYYRIYYIYSHFS